MAVPYTFGSATTSIPLSQLDSNFATTITLGNTAIQLGNTVTTLNNMTLANVTISSGTSALTSTSIANGTSNVSIASSGGNVVVSTNGATAQTIDTGQRTKFPTTIGVGNATPSTSGSGISFPATQSPSSDVNTLDDYEEGTYTPTILFNTTNGDLAYSVQVGFYTKVGNLVYVGGKIVFSQTTARSYLFMDNLPFTAKNSSNYFPATGIGVTSMTGISGGVVLQPQANGVTAYPYTGTTGNYGVISYLFCNGGSAEIDFGFTYISN